MQSIGVNQQVACFIFMIPSQVTVLPCTACVRAVSMVAIGSRHPFAHSRYLFHWVQHKSVCSGKAFRNFFPLLQYTVDSHRRSNVCDVKRWTCCAAGLRPETSCQMRHDCTRHTTLP